MTKAFRLSHALVWCFVIAFSAFLAVANAHAQYTQTNLVTTSQDPNLANAWGLAYGSGGPFWVSDEQSGKSTVYDASGTIISEVVSIPAARGSKGSPSGIVANASTGFVISEGGVSAPAAFIFATLDGTISGWNSSVDATNAVIAVNNSTTSSYSGLAIATISGTTLLYAANSAKNQIEIYNNKFKLVKTFNDSSLTGMSVYGVQAIKGKIFVTFNGAGGAVDIFSPAGTLVKKLTSNPSGGTLNSPWGLALAPNNFGVMSNALLVGNVSDGHINAFNASTGALIGPLKDTTGKIIANPGLWGLQFGGGTGNSGNGNTNQLFLTAGTGGYTTGLFAVIH